MADLSKTGVERIIRKAGAQRVSKAAVDELAKILEDIGLDIAQQSVKLAMHAGRKTVTAEDVKLAFNTIFG